MATVQFGEYSAFDSGKGIRFQQNKRLVSESAVPPEVVSYLKSQLKVEPAPIPKPKFPRPSDEELERMRAESAQVKPELQLTPEEEAARAAQPLPEPSPLADVDFEEEPLPIEAPTDEQVLEEATVDPEFMERTSIYTADIKDIAQALYDRFGVYTIWLNATPQTDEINPLTGEAFSRYHQGIAYQALVKARNTGFFNRPSEIGRDNIVAGRVAHEQFVAEKDLPVGDNRVSSFAHRTSPAANAQADTYISHEPDPVTGEIRAVQRTIPNAAQHSGKVNNATQRHDAVTDEMLVEPRFGQKVIRPNW